MTQRKLEKEDSGTNNRWKKNKINCEPVDINL